MKNWQVIKTKIKIYPHLNSDNLELLKIGDYQCVSQKGIYKDGDMVIFAPEKSVLPKDLQEPFKKYLRGPSKDRVGSIRLRGELSQGIVLPLNEIDPLDVFPLDVDISSKLNITKYEPPIPQHLAGEVEVLKDLNIEQVNHDVEQFGIYTDNFEGKLVNVFEKIHGSQVVLIRHKSGERQVSSKGLYKKGLCLQKSKDNTYWQAVENSRLFNLLDKYFPGVTVQAFGEVVPIQKGFNYGCDRPTIFLFRLVVGKKELAFSKIDIKFLKEAQWCPLIEKNVLFDKMKLLKLGKKLKHSVLNSNTVAEGIVISPVIPFYTSNMTNQYLKIISDRYAKVEDPDAIS